MSRHLLLTTAAIAGALTLGCGDQQNSPTSPTTNLSLVASSEVTPSLGAETDRFQVVDFVSFVDFENGLTVFWGLSHEQLVLACAGQPIEPDFSTVLTVLRPDGSRKLLLQSRDVPMSIYETTDTDLCGVLAQTSPLATGTASVTRTDNDSDFTEARRAVSTGFTINGDATTTDGTTLKVHGHVRALRLPSGEFKIVNEEIRIE